VVDEAGADEVEAPVEAEVEADFADGAEAADEESADEEPGDGDEQATDE